MHQSRWILLVLAALAQADPVEISDTDYDSLDGAGLQILAIERSVPFSHSPKITIDPYQVPTVPSLQLRPLNRGQDVSSTDGVAVVRTGSDGVHEYPDGISATEYDSYDNDSMLEVLDDHGASISTPPDLHVVVKHEIPELAGDDVIEIPPIDLIIAADDSGPSSDLQDAPNIHLVFQTAQQPESSNQTLTNATDFFGLRNTTHQSPKTDNSANSDILFDDTELFHDLAQSDTDAVEICKSYAFDPSQINYHISQTDEWLRDYARKNAENPFFRQHGLIATVAFDHLGINNFICSIGTEHLCRIDCPTVVKSIDDLHLARRVYFALASASNFLTTTSIIHGALDAAQGNVGLLAQKMSYDYSWWHPSEDERRRELAYQFFINVCIWSAQTMFNTLTPMIPWRHMQHYVGTKATSVIDNWKAPKTAPSEEDFPSWRESRIWRTLGSVLRFEGVGSSLDMDPQTWPLGQLSEPQANHWNEWAVDAEGLRYRHDSDVSDGGSERQNFGFRRRNNNVPSNVLEALSNMNGMPGTLPTTPSGGDYFTAQEPSRSSTVATVPSYIGADSHLVRRTHDGTNRGTISVGPVNRAEWRDNQDPNSPGFALNVWSRGINSMFDGAPEVVRTPPPPPVTNRFVGISDKMDRARARMKILLPLATGYAGPVLIRELFSAMTWRGTEGSRDGNAANLAVMISQAGQASRKFIKDRVNGIFRDANVRGDGTMELIDAMAMGSFLPADRESLGKWTDSTVESALTKNLFLRTLNMSWKTQRIFIMCTGDFVNKKHPNTLRNDKGRKVAYSEHDNSGPQHLKAHVGDEVCYMYRWNDRGFWPGHHVEDPYGWDTFTGEPWNLKTSDIITSSVLAARRPASDLEMLASSSRLAIGPNAEFIADPTTPGMFNLPVCHTHWNWNGPTEGVSIFKTDLNAFSGHKIMPCYCGALGADTKRIWEQLRLDTSGARRHYLLDSCPRQISAKIDNPLERYVAYCRLGIHRKLGVPKWGEDKLCDVVIAELEKHGVKDVQSDMDDEQILGFLCKIERSKVHPDCWRFRKTPMDKVWEEAQALSSLDKRRRKDAWRAFKDFLRLD